MAGGGTKQMDSSTWTGFTEEEKANIRRNYENANGGIGRASSQDVIITSVPKQGNPPNSRKNVRKSKSTEDGVVLKPLVMTGDLPPEALLSAKPKSRGLESPTHVKLKIVENGSFEIIETKNTTTEESSEKPPSTLSDPSPPPKVESETDGDKKDKIDLEEFDRRQKLIEEQNRLKKEMLGKALALRKMKTQAEAQKLQKIQEELSRLDASLSSDVSILRSHIEVASVELAEAEKRYDKAEKEFIEAKKHLFGKRERKELLTEHLCAIIEQNEMRKAHRLTDLMIQLAEQDQAAEVALSEIVTNPVSVETSVPSNSL